MTRKRKQRRGVRLLAEVIVDKVWAACVALAGDGWVSIDALGDFLRMRQLDASAVSFDPADPNTRYALQPRLTKWTRGWEDGVLARALSEAVTYGFLENDKNDEGTNLFRAKKDPSGSLYKLQDTSVPTSPTWAQLRATHV